MYMIKAYLKAQSKLGVLSIGWLMAYFVLIAILSFIDIIRVVNGDLDAINHESFGRNDLIIAMMIIIMPFIGLIFSIISLFLKGKKTLSIFGLIVNGSIAMSILF